MLQSIDGKYVAVTGLSNGEVTVFDPARSDALNSLMTFEVGYGYWVKMSSAATLTVQGTSVDSSTPIELHVGWNLVAYLPDSPMAVDTALASIDGKFQEVRSFAAEAHTFLAGIPAEFNTLTAMEPGMGYLVYMTQAGTLRYP